MTYQRRLIYSGVAKVEQGLDEAVSRYRALGDETRLRILQMLVGSEVCVCDLAGELEIAQPLLSHHLKALREAGLVQARRDGRWMHYSLDAEVVEDLGGTLSKLASDHRERGTPDIKCC